jgi:hypothetical protein
MKRIFCAIIFILICSMVRSQPISENNSKDPLEINTVVHSSKPDSLYSKLTYTTVDNSGHKFVSIKGDENNHKFQLVIIKTRKDSAGNKYKVLIGFRPAEFPGGVPAWGQYLKNHLRSGLGSSYIKIPEGEVSAQQTVIVSFTIDSLGNTADIKVLNENEVHPKLAEEAIRVIKDSPRWVPDLHEEFAFPDGAIALHKIKSEPVRHKQSIIFKSLHN